MIAPEAKKQKLDAAAPRSVPRASCSPEPAASSSLSCPGSAARRAFSSWNESEGSQSQS